MKIGNYIHYFWYIQHWDEFKMTVKESYTQHHCPVIVTSDASAQSIEAEGLETVIGIAGISIGS